MSNKIGGFLIPSALGWLTLNTIGADGTLSRPGSTANNTILDVINWQHQETKTTVDLPIAGLLGVPTTRCIQKSHDIVFDLLYDPSNPPELLFYGPVTVKSPTDIIQKCGFSMTMVLGANYGGYPEITDASNAPWYWYCPLATIDTKSEKVNAMNYKLVSQSVMAHALTPMFLMPMEQDKMNAYLSYFNGLKGRLWI